MSNDVFEILSEGTVETNSGEMVTDNQSTFGFDEVEQLTDNIDEVKELHKLSKASEKVEKKEKEVVKTSDDSQEVLEEFKSTKKDSPKKKDVEKDDEGIEEQVENLNKEHKEDIPKDIKKIFAKFGENSLEIPSEALIPHKVDGEEVEIPLQELLNNYSGKQAWDKRFSELDRERKEYQKERDLVERYVNDFSQLAQGEDKMAAMEYLAEFAGISPVEFRRQLRQQVLEKYGNYQEMSELERKALDQEEELTYHKRVKESETQRVDEQKAVQELQNRLQEIQETHNISEDDLKVAYEELTSDYDGDVTPEILEKYVVNKNAWFSAKNTVSEIAPQLIENTGFIEDIADMILSNPDLDADDIRDIVNEFTVDSKKRHKQQKVSEKIRESQKSPSEKVPLQKEEYLTFDDL